MVNIYKCAIFCDRDLSKAALSVVYFATMLLEIKTQYQATVQYIKTANETN